EWWPFDSLRRDIDQWFNEFGNRFGRLPIQHELPFVASPPVDVVEKDGAYEITAELPGISEPDLEVKCTGDTITIKGEKKEEKEEKKKDYYLSERRFGTFRRSFRMPEGTDPDKIKATFKDGVLTLTLPKTPEAQKRERRIEIQKA